MSGQITSEGKRLVDNWSRAQKLVRQRKADLNRAEGEEISTREALAKWMLPDGVQIGEKIAVWHGDSLIQVEYRGVGQLPIVCVRLRGKHGFEDGLPTPKVGPC